MRIMKTKGGRGRGEFFWTVNGVASFGRIEDAAELAIEALCDAMKAHAAPTLWTQYGIAS
jgi:hypothetical protein